MNKKYAVFSAIPYEKDGKKMTRWHRLGRGVLHRNGKGVNIYLDSLPKDGFLAMFPENVEPPSDE